MFEEFLYSNLSHLITAGVTLFIAWVKRKWDINKWKKEGRLTEIKKYQQNGKH